MPGLADPVTCAVAVLAEPLELLGRDLARVAEDLRRERRVRVVAQVDLHDLHAGELGLVLVEVVDLLLADRRLDDDRRQRVEAALLDLRGRARAARRRGRSRAAGRARSDPPSACRRPRARTAVPATFETTTRPWRSRIGPRGASTRIEAQLVVLRRVQVLVAREHLQRPEPQEEDGERERARRRRGSRRAARAAA